MVSILSVPLLSPCMNGLVPFCNHSTHLAFSIDFIGRLMPTSNSCSTEIMPSNRIIGGKYDGHWTPPHRNISQIFQLSDANTTGVLRVIWYKCNFLIFFFCFYYFNLIFWHSKLSITHVFTLRTNLSLYTHTHTHTHTHTYIYIYIYIYI